MTKKIVSLAVLALAVVGAFYVYKNVRARMQAKKAAAKTT
jgi:hypothetical protein